jgi:hypothetical protein
MGNFPGYIGPQKLDSEIRACEWLTKSAFFSVAKKMSKGKTTLAEFG